MSVRTDTVNLIVNVNGSNAQNNLNILRKKAAEISFEMKGMVKGTAEYIAKGKELSSITTQMDALKKTIGLTSLSQKELTAELNKLKALRGSVVPFSEEYNKLNTSIKEVKSRLDDVRNGTQGFSSMLGKLGEGVKQFGVMAAAYLGAQFLITQFKNIVTGAAKLSDQLADLQRVSGFTSQEAMNLNKQLTALDTRTTTEGLRNIAIIAGKLGVAKEDVFSFTEAVDKLVVSLGDELGDADQITTQLGKILNVFDGKVTGENITRLGNTFVELANSGAATGAFIADFDQRLSGIAKSAGISLGALSGLGAGLEEMGGRVESSATAIQKLVISIASDIPAAAKIAGQTTAEFNKLFTLDPTEAILRYSQGLVKNKQSFAEVTASLKDAGEEGARTIETITKLGTGADMLRGRIDAGVESNTKAIAVTEAFRLKNETFGASMEKLGKQLNNVLTNSKLTDFIQGLVQGFINLITPVKSAVIEFDDLNNKVNHLQKDISPLLDRYDELKKRTILNKEEQAELKKIVQEVTNVLPGAVIEFDKYGNAISINTVRVRDFIEAEKARLKVVNVKAIDEYNKKLEETNASLKGIKFTLDEVAKTGTFATSVSTGDVSTGGSSRSVKASQDEVAAIESKFKQLLSLKLGYETELKRLNGQSIDDQVKATEEARKKAESDIIKETEKHTGAGVGLIKALRDKIKTLDDALPDITSKKLITENIAARKKLQDELDSLEGKKSPQKKKDTNEFERLKKEAEKFQEELLKLKERAQIKGEEPEQAEIDKVKLKYAELILKAKQFYKDAIINESQFNDDINKITEAEVIERQNIFERFLKIKLKAAEKAAEDEAKERKEAEKRVLNDLAEINESMGRDVLAKAQRRILQSRPGSDEEYEARKALLIVQREQVKESKKLSIEELKLLDAEYEEQKRVLDNDRLQQQVDNVLKYVNAFQNALTSFNKILNNRDLIQFNKEKKLSDQKLKLYKDQLDHKLISQGVYDKKVLAANEELDKKDREIKRKQAIREKALGIFEAVINTAAAIAQANPVIPLMILAGLAGALQIAAISNTPLPELGKGDWIREGDKHSDASGGINAKIERDEAVISAAAMTNKSVYTIKIGRAHV